MPTLMDFLWLKNKLTNPFLYSNKPRAAFLLSHVQWNKKY